MNVIGQNESAPEYRRLYFWLVQSNGTSAATTELGATVQLALNGSQTFTSAGTLLSTNTTRGRYYVQLTQSETSKTGTLQAFYSSTTCFEMSNYGGPVTIMPQSVMVPQYASYGSRLQGATAITVTLASGETTVNDFFNGAGVVVQYPDGAVALNVVSDYTGSSKAASMVNQWTVTPTSSCTYAILPGSIAAQFSSIDIATLASSTAVDVWGFDIGSGRIAEEALYALRNRVLVTPGSSVGTVYGADDTTSAWTFSVTTSTIGLAGVDPSS